MRRDTSPEMYPNPYGFADLTFDPRAVVWLREPPAPSFDRTEPRETTHPASVPGSPAWEVWCGRQKLWTFNQPDFVAARAEKDRLCLANGYRPGHCRVFPVSTSREARSVLREPVSPERVRAGLLPRRVGSC